MTKRVVAVLGVGVVDGEDRILTADDLGLTRGDGCFDATRVVIGADGTQHVDHLDEHLRRLQASSASLQLPDVDQPAWRSLIKELLAEWTTPGEAMLKLMISRGRESTPTGPITGIATLTAMSEVTLAQREHGISVLTLSRGTAADAFADAPWLLGGVKSLSYAVNMAGQRVAAEHGADDVIFTSSDGFVLEAPTAAVVWSVGGRLLTTPTGATGILDSITQKALFHAAAASELATEYRLGTVADLRAADGVWLVSSGRGVAGVRGIDGSPIAHDAALSRRVASLAGF